MSCSAQYGRLLPGSPSCRRAWRAGWSAGSVRRGGAGPLTQREIEVLELVAAGNSNRETAVRLFISEATVKSHLLNLYLKLGVNDRAAAVAEGFRRGLLTGP
jgi:ATP/maltotriose-dependent transcriptional regulator MalT